MTLDRIDLNILDLLQRDATIPLGRIADRVGLSPTPCWKRVKKLEAAGAIRGRVALLDPDALGLAVTAFLVVEAGDQGRDWRAAFREAVGGLDAVVELHRLSGRADFLAKVRVRTLADLDALVETLTARVPMRACEVLISSERLQETTAVPIPAPEPARAAG